MIKVCEAAKQRWLSLPSRAPSWSVTMSSWHVSRQTSLSLRQLSSEPPLKTLAPRHVFSLGLLMQRFILSWATSNDSALGHIITGHHKTSQSPYVLYIEHNCICFLSESPSPFPNKTPLLSSRPPLLSTLILTSFSKTLLLLLLVSLYTENDFRDLPCIQDLINSRLMRSLSSSPLHRQNPQRISPNPNQTHQQVPPLPL